MDEGTEQRLMNSLEKTLKYRIKNEIRQAILDKKDITQLQKDMRARNTLPRGTLTAAEQDTGVKAAELDKLMKRKKEKPIAYYQKFVLREYQALLKEVENKLTAESKETSEQGTVSVTPEGLLEEDSKDDNENELQTVSHPFEPLLLTDLPADIKEAVLLTVGVNLRSSSDYIIAYSVQVLKMISLFKNHTFTRRPDATYALDSKVGSHVYSILPQEFIVTEEITHFPPPSNLSLLNDLAFKKDLENIFSAPHLQTLHADYFGSGTSRRKGSFPCVDALKAAFQQEKRREVSEPYVMKLALSRYINNFKTMWSNYKRQYRLLNNVLIVLLRIHLAPDRERSRREYIEKKKNEQAQRVLDLLKTLLNTSYQVLQIDHKMDAEDCLIVKKASFKSTNQK